jgi:hypothetical protein
MLIYTINNIVSIEKWSSVALTCMPGVIRNVSILPFAKTSMGVWNYHICFLGKCCISLLFLHCPGPQAYSIMSLQYVLWVTWLITFCRDILRWGRNIVSSKTRTRKRAGIAVYNRASSLETLVCNTLKLRIILFYAAICVENNCHIVDLVFC